MLLSLLPPPSIFHLFEYLQINSTTDISLFIFYQLKNPPIAILDEATAALDTVTEREVQEALVTLGRDRTVLVIAHRLSTIKDADLILVLERGVVVERGTHEELIGLLGGRYARMWEDSRKREGIIMKK